MFSNSTLRLTFVIIVTTLTLLSLILFKKYNTSLQKAYDNIERIEKVNVTAFAKNIENRLMKDYRKYLQNPTNIKKSIQKELDDTLSMFVGEQYTYVFLILYDKEKKYRYVSDGAKNIKDKGEYLQKFNPAYDDKWNEVIKTNKPVWIAQTSINNLWLTYLHPISMKNSTKLILAFDFSAKEYLALKNIFSPINNYLKLIVLILTILLFIIYIFGYLFYKQRTKTYIDPLTGVFNRHYLNRISNTLKLKNICIALIDLDHFKRINDIYGHDVGDMVLKEVSFRLRDILRPNDILIRYGGEEFLLFLSKNSKKKGDEEEIISSIQKRVSQELLQIQKESFQITVSIGFNATPHLNRSLHEAIEFADKMLYTAKINGRNRVEVFKEDRIGKDTVFGPREIMQALNENRIKAYFQPIMDTKTKKVSRYEMLVRIFSKSGQIILPYKFLPNIKSNSSYRDISKFMLDKAIKTIQENNVNVSVNFEIMDFLDATLCEQIYDILSVNKDFASQLTIELLENMEIKDLNLVKKRIDKLKSLGIKIALDDFGSGYSTYNYLLVLKPDILKIDGCLIKELPHNKQAQDVVSSIVDVCKKFNIQTVAEFVNSDIIIQKATSMDIDYLQGYAIGKPNNSLELKK